MRWHHSRQAVAVLAGVPVLSGSGAQAGGITLIRSVRFDLTASAHPHVATAPVSDHEFHVDTVFWANTDAVTTATASAVCSGCSGEAVSVHVLYLGQSPATKLDNVAIAWTQGCGSCDATAVSLQVAIVTGTRSLTPSNRALALNAACLACGARSAAYQLVVAGSTLPRLSSASLRSLQDWAAARASLLRDESTSAVLRSRVEQDRALTGIARLVNHDLGTHTVVARTRLSSR